MASGLIFGLMDIEPVPLIITAQAINGLILPVISIILVIVINDIQTHFTGHRNSTINNSLLFLIVFICSFLGINSILKSLSIILESELGNASYLINLLVSLVITVGLIFRIFGEKERRMFT